MDCAICYTIDFETVYNKSRKRSASDLPHRFPRSVEAASARFSGPLIYSPGWLLREALTPLCRFRGFVRPVFVFRCGIVCPRHAPSGRNRLSTIRLKVFSWSSGVVFWSFEFFYCLF